MVNCVTTKFKEKKILVSIQRVPNLVHTLISLNTVLKLKRRKTNCCRTTESIQWTTNMIANMEMMLKPDMIQMTIHLLQDHQWVF